MTRCHSGLLLFALLLGLLQAAGCGKRSGSADASGEARQTPGPAGSATADAKPSGEPVPGGIRDGARRAGKDGGGLPECTGV